MASKERRRSAAWIEAHNAEARAVWEAFHAGRPTRPPVALVANARLFIFNEELNPGERVIFEDYSTDGVTMLQLQLRAAEWRAANIAPYCDDPVGLPETFSVYVDLQTYDDPEYARALLDFVTEGTIARIHAHRRLFGLNEVAPDLFFSDDAIQLISSEMLAEFLLPVYRKLKAALTTADRIKIHLCGDATRHFKMLKEELGVYDFETGYPVDFGWLRQELGPEVTIHGGPSAIMLQQASAGEIRAETERILNSGIFYGGRFVLREGNNLAPGTPRANLEAMYETARARLPNSVPSHHAEQVYHQNEKPTMQRPPIGVVGSTHC